MNCYIPDCPPPPPHHHPIPGCPISLHCIAFSLTLLAFFHTGFGFRVGVCNPSGRARLALWQSINLSLVELINSSKVELISRSKVEIINPFEVGYVILARAVPVGFFLLVSLIVLWTLAFVVWLLPLLLLLLLLLFLLLLLLPPPPPAFYSAITPVLQGSLRFANIYWNRVKYAHWLKYKQHNAPAQHNTHHIHHTHTHTHTQQQKSARQISYSKMHTKTPHQRCQKAGHCNTDLWRFVCRFVYPSYLHARDTQSLLKVVYW